MNKSHVEMDALIYSLNQAYGFDFSNYKRDMIHKRIEDFIKIHHYFSPSDLLHACLYNNVLASNLINSFLTDYTSMFRDPEVYQSIRESLLPLLQTEPIIRIWCAGCSSGEEPFSIAIMLKEEGLYDRSIIYATDINQLALAQAKNGIIKYSAIHDYADNYKKAGGKKDFYEYLNVGNDTCTLHPHMRENIIFSRHDLVRDYGFNEFSIIVCRNVLIYFNDKLKYSILSKFYENLKPLGFFIAGEDEDISTCLEQLKLKSIFRSGIYRKQGI